MYHEDFGFDAVTLAGPLDNDAPMEPADTLEQEFAAHLLGLVLASDLFAARNPGPRAWLEKVALATCWPDTRIFYSGERLDQDDLDTFLGCALLALRSPGRGRGSVRLHPRELARLIHPTGRRFDAKRQERSLWRLTAARLDIEDAGGDYVMQARLFNALLCDHASGVCAVDVSPRILEGFAGAARVERLLASRASLADGLHRWLAGFLAHGPTDLRLDIGALRRLCGLTRQPLAAFRERAVAALREFLDCGVIAAIESGGPDRLIVRRPAARGEEAACLLLS